MMTAAATPDTEAPLSVLFVDDQPNLLMGLQRSLRSMRHEWTMRFAPGGREALALMAEAPADVIVTDMRMPEMDGAELLAEIRQHYPDTVRIILSGQFDQETGLRALESTHQFLSKPCDSAHLIDAIRRSARRRRLLGNETVRGIVSALNVLPSPPAVYSQLLQLVQSADAPSRAIADLIDNDVGLLTKILQLANSSFFFLGARVSSALQALNMLGLDVIRALVLSHGIEYNFKDKLPSQAFDALWEDATSTASIAARLARHLKLGGTVESDAFAAGMLHDVGCLLFMAVEHIDYRQLLESSKEGIEVQLAMERQIFGATHAEVGAYLLGLWNLPDPIVETAAFHHHPSDAGSQEKGALAMVHVAHWLHAPTAAERGGLDHDYLTSLGLPTAAEEWQALLTRKNP